MPRGSATESRYSGGTALLALTIILMITAIGLVTWLPRATLEVKRAKEDELRFILSEFRRAKVKFTACNGRPPQTLEEMCLDAAGRRFLRRIYSDPMTGKADWFVQSTVDGIEIHSSCYDESIAGIPYSQFR